jgi:arylsulfatase
MAAAALLLAGCAAHVPAETASKARPNVVLIVADDLGYSDLGAFGGEIDTPNLDALAMAGLRLTDFHSAPACSPTRSMLMSGSDNHTAGVGKMAEVTIPALEGRWGYEGALTTRVATLAERLRAGGYQTMMSGKWHLGLTPDEDPHARGFDRSFALLQGAHNHFGQGGFGEQWNPKVGATYTDDGRVTTIPSDFYSSDYFTTKLIQQIDASDSRRPFFAYLAFTAPHSPLMAPKDLIAKYHGRYDAGWEVLREQRLARLKALGLVAADVTPHEIVPDPHAWEKLSPEQKKIESRKMEIYAAMVDRLDQNAGRLVRRLKQTGRYDNTIFIFTSDNGPAGEILDTFLGLPSVKERMARSDNSLDNMGSATSMVFYGPYWAQAASAPSRLYKAMVAEGGVHVPSFITYPGLHRQGGIGRAFATVMDILPTVLAATDTPVTNKVAGREVAEIRGRSMLPYLLAKTETVHPADEMVALELHGQRLVRQGDWKLIWMPKPFGKGGWELFDLASDRGERIDLGDKYPERRDAMAAAWNAYAKEAHVVVAP